MAFVKWLGVLDAGESREESLKKRNSDVYVKERLY